VIVKAPAAGSIVSENCCEAVAPSISFTAIVKMDVPVVKLVPLITVPLSTNPLGSVPTVTLHV
jgi:hypothetical protein